MTDQFAGCWLVSEYVFDPNGRFAGMIHQKRQLFTRPDQSLRVVQECTPDERLTGHPMEHFAGEWEFTMTVDGSVRRYHGPDVIGTGLAWGNDPVCIMGRGVWPRFGHNFASFSILVSPEQQLTGGWFYNAGELVASIAGIAVPNTVGSYPSLDRLEYPHHIAKQWHGHLTQYDANGIMQSKREIRRQYDSTSWTDNDDRWEIKPLDGRDRISGCCTGIGIRSGWIYQATTILSDGTRATLLEIHNGKLIIGIQQYWIVDSLRNRDIYKLEALV